MNSPLLPSTIISSLTAYPRRLWDEKCLVMLEAYIDDSTSARAGKIFVLAGYSASASEWERFIEDWASTLSQAPSIKYLTMKEAIERKSGERVEKEGHRRKRDTIEVGMPLSYDTSRQPGRMISDQKLMVITLKH